MSIILPLITALVGTIGLALVFRRSSKPAVSTKVEPRYTASNIIEIENIVGTLESQYEKASRELSVVTR